MKLKLEFEWNLAGSTMTITNPKALSQLDGAEYDYAVSRLMYALMRFGHKRQDVERDVWSLKEIKDLPLFPTETTQPDTSVQKEKS